MRKTLRLTLLLFIAALGLSCCRKSPTGDANGVVQLDYVAFMKYDHDIIADSLAKILGVAPISYSQTVPSSSLPIMAGVQWTKEGYQYVAENGAKIVIWVDTSDEPYFLTYVLRRGGVSDDWSYDQDKVDSSVVDILGQVGIDLGGSEEFVSRRVAAFPRHWYSIRLTQTFRDTALSYPYTLAELEGNTGEVNFLGINRWYLNLSEIKNILSHDYLREIAMEYYAQMDEVASLPDTIRIYDFDIVKDTLCRRVGTACVDSLLCIDLFIDIQTGRVIDEERRYYDRTRSMLGPD